MLSGMALMPVIDVGQIRAVDHSRILGLVGMLEQEYWEIIQTALNVVLGFVV
ncbi:transcriptional modulator of MazE/toxin MazF [Tolypothrix sp. NIES-4075]|nr:transcriptional modulator of MazE/toxin MazF [Tolypothrix sp. NIES-4075]